MRVYLVILASAADELDGKIQTLHRGTTAQHLLKGITMPILLLTCLSKMLKGQKIDSNVDSLQSNSSLLDIFIHVLVIYGDGWILLGFHLLLKRFRILTVSYGWQLILKWW